MKTLESFFKKNTRKILPFLLTVSLSLSLFSIYQISFFSVWTLAIILVSAVMFLFCDFINDHHFIGGTALTVVIMLALFTFIRLALGHDLGQSFQTWFLTGADQVSTSTEFLLAFMVSFVPFFAVVIYYFTLVLYRMSFLTLICLIPCSVSVKVLTDIDNVYISVIAILSVAALMQNVRSERERAMSRSGTAASLFSAAFFIFVLLIVSAAIPKESETRYYDRFEELFMDRTMNGRLLSDYSLMSEFSGGADLFRNFSNVRMYTLYGEYPPYFKRQTFDYYDFENKRWYPDEYYSEPSVTSEEWSEKAQLYGLGDLQRAIKNADGYSPGFAEKYGLDRIAGYSPIDDGIKTMYVQSEGFGAIYYLSPARAVNIIPYGRTEDIYVTPAGVFRNRLRPHSNTLAYQIEYYDEYGSRFLWMELGGADFDDNGCLFMLTEMYNILAENNDPLADNISALIDVHAGAVKYKSVYESNTEEISEELSALAREVTAGLEYDWQKAEALQRYFTNTDFIYDLEYVSPDDSTEYFVFTSKRGSCSDFASAFVLLARSLGLTVRYTEGYSPDITTRENTYVIKDSGSHAYPEVYIQNMGWIVFEPTVPSDYNSAAADDAGDIVFRVDYDLVTVICAIAGILLILALSAVVLYPVISEKKFVSDIAKADPNDCVIMVYKRISSKTASKIIRNSGCLTPYEFASRLEEITGCDISPIAYISEETVYGGKNAGEEEKRISCKGYGMAAEKIKKYLREKRKQDRKAVVNHGKRG